MKGYKGMTADMTCRGMKYEIGKTYHEDNIALCERGLHFCKNLHDVFDYYQWGEANRFFEVGAFGKVIMGDNKYCTSDLTIIKELSKIEVNRARYGNGCGEGYIYDYGEGYSYGEGYGCGDGYHNGNGYGNHHRYSNGSDYGYGTGISNHFQQFVIFKEEL